VMLGVGDSEPVEVTEEVGDADAVMLLVELLVAVSLLDALREADVDGDGDAVAETLFDWLGELVTELLALSVGLWLAVMLPLAVMEALAVRLVEAEIEAVMLLLAEAELLTLELLDGLLLALLLADGVFVSDDDAVMVADWLPLMLADADSDGEIVWLAVNDAD